MKQCPRCKELIGDALTTCPNCHTEFTEKQIVECISYGTHIMEQENVFFTVCGEYIKERNYSLIDIMQIWLPK